MHVLTLTVDLHLNDAQSLKMKRSVVKSIVREYEWVGRHMNLRLVL